MQCKYCDMTTTNVTLVLYQEHVTELFPLILVQTARENVLVVNRQSVHLMRIVLV